MKNIGRAVSVAAALLAVLGSQVWAQQLHVDPPSGGETVTVVGVTSGSANAQGQSGISVVTFDADGTGTVQLPAGASRSEVEAVLGPWLTSLLVRDGVIRFVDGALVVNEDFQREEDEDEASDDEVEKPNGGRETTRQGGSN